VEARATQISIDSEPPETLPAEWLSLGPASRVLGVDPDTLRRWADEGRVDVFTTPGGHRRFQRRGLERLVAARRTGYRATLAGLGATPDRLSAAYRRRYGSRSRDHLDPRTSVPVGEHAAYRDDGRRLVRALIAHLDASSAAERDRAEAEALDLTADLGRRLAAGGVELGEAIALFVAARRPFLAELGAIARRRGLDSIRLTTLYEAATAILDRLLLRLVDSHRATVSSPPRRSPLPLARP
jgi:hypothetical protein